MKLTKTLTTGALALLIATAPAAMAKSKQHRSSLDSEFEQTFTRLDLNRDGVLTRAELGPYGGYFEHLDTNRDRRITRDESRRVLQREESRLRGMDTNGDGVITRREWRGNNTSFAQLDRNRDGVISMADKR